MCCLSSEGAGIYDVCEKEPTDAMDYLTLQQREDITTSAQVYNSIDYYQSCCYRAVIYVL